MSERVAPAMIQMFGRPWMQMFARPWMLYLIVSVAIVSMLCVRDGEFAIMMIPVVGAVLVFALATRLASDPWLRWIALGKLLLGVAVTAGLYWISFAVDRHEGLARMVFRPGFWVFGGDAVFYHRKGVQLAYSLQHGIPFPVAHEFDLSYGVGLVELVTLLYYAFGAHALLVPFINCLLAAVSVIFTYVLVSRIASRQVALAASVAVAAWPSGFLWASQIMKDLPCVFLLLLTLLLLFELTDTREPTVRWPKTIALAAALFISGYLLVLLKFYLINLLLLAVAASVVVRIASKRRGLRVTDAVAVVVILLTALIGRGAGQNSVLLYLNPKSSDAIPAYLAGMELERQDVVASRQFYELAIKRQPQFWPAYRKLGVLLMRTGEIRAAIDVLQRYVTLYPFDYAAPAIRRVLLEAKALMDSGVGPTDPRFAKVQQSMLDALDPSYGGDAEFLATALKHERPGKRRALMSGRQLVTDLSTEYAANLRNGFIKTGGDSIYTVEFAKPEGGPLQWIKWSPRAFLTAVGAPFPWQWRKPNGPLDPMRAASGIESLLLLILLPLGAYGAWRSLRSTTVADLTLVGLFALLMTALGLVVVNVGTMVRLRLPGIYLLVVLAAVGMSHAIHAKSERSQFP